MLMRGKIGNSREKVKFLVENSALARSYWVLHTPNRWLSCMLTM